MHVHRKVFVFIFHIGAYLSKNTPIHFNIVIMNSNINIIIYMFGFVLPLRAQPFTIIKSITL